MLCMAVVITSEIPVDMEAMSDTNPTPQKLNSDAA